MRATVPSPEALRQHVADAEARLLESGGGLAPKTLSAVSSLANKWTEWMDTHGHEYGYEVGAAPTLEQARRFQTHGYYERSIEYSSVGAEGMGDSWGRLAVPYLLPRYVFPYLQFEGWVGLGVAERNEKVRPFLLELKENWDNLKSTVVRAGTGNGRSFKKERWPDGLLYVAQDACMGDTLRVNRAVMRLAVLGFVKVTCSRPGAFARDWADRAGKTLQWVGRNVLSVRDVTFENGFMTLEHIEESELPDVVVQHCRYES